MNFTWKKEDSSDAYEARVIHYGPAGGITVTEKYRKPVMLDKVTVKPGDSYVNMGTICFVLAVYAEGWQSRTIFPSYVDSVLVLISHPGLRVITLDVEHVQSLVEVQKSMDRGEGPEKWINA